MLQAFKKTFRPLRENISTYETKRFGVSGSLRQKDTDDKKQDFPQKKEAFYLESYFFFLHLRQEINKTFFYENNNGKYILLVAPLTTPKVVRGTQPCVDT